MHNILLSKKEAIEHGIKHEIFDDLIDSEMIHMNVEFNCDFTNMPKEKWYGNVVAGCTESKTHDYPCGNIFTETLEDIWNGEGFKELRKALIENSDKECREMCLLHRFK